MEESANIGLILNTIEVNINNFSILGYVFRGTLNNAGGDSYLEIFKLEGNIPSEDPVLTIDNN